MLCSLSTEDQERRFAEFGALARNALLEAEQTPDGALIRLRDDAAVRSELDRLIESERRCCSFLEFAVEEAEGELLVGVSGPPQARPLIGRLFEP
jgi:hypothetical protein